MTPTSNGSSTVRPAVWFERRLLPELAAEVTTRAMVLGPATSDDPHAGAAEAAGAVVGPGIYGRAFMDRAPNLRVIARTGIGYDRVDVAEATGRGICVCNTPDAPTISTAEHAAALILAVSKGLKRAESTLRDDGRGDLYLRHRAIELKGKVLGLVGFGRIARRVATIGASLSMSVRSYDPLVADSDVPPSVARARSLDELLAAADVVSVHVPLTDATRGMFGSEQFAGMKRGAIFVNTARGGLVDTDALLAALEAGRLFGAGLDVTEPEPLPPEHPLLHRDDVVVTPHVASATAEGRVRLVREAFEQVIDVLEGRRPPHLVNPEVWRQPPLWGTRV